MWPPGVWDDAGLPLLLLDLDNTIADRDGAFRYWVDYKVAAWAPDDPGARRFLLDADEDGFRPREDFGRRVKERFGAPESVEALLREYRRVVLAGLPRMRPEVGRSLRAVRAEGWKVAVVTNGDGAQQAAKVKRMGLAPLLDACVVSGTVGLRKPDPRIFALAARRCGNPPGPAWMIGDSEVDILGASRAGLRSVWLHRNRAWTRGDLRPDVIAADVTEAILAATTSSRHETSP